MQASIAQPQREQLPELFARSFAVVRADTPALLDALLRLRYQVYCVENNYEKAGEFPDQRETDSFDKWSLHSALIYRPMNAVIGGVRLIQEGPDAPPLPIRSVVGRTEATFLRKLPREMAEISRYAVTGSFRRRQGETEYPDIALHDWSSEEERRRVLPHITLGLMRAILGFCGEGNIRVLCATMAPALLRLLDRCGLHFQPIGPMVAFHGLRQPCFAWYEELLEGLRTRRPDFYEVVQRGFDEGWGLGAVPPRRPEDRLRRMPATVVVGKRRLQLCAAVTPRFAPGDAEANGELEWNTQEGLDSLFRPGQKAWIWFGDTHPYELHIQPRGHAFHAFLRHDGPMLESAPA